jgi:MFS family permease
VRGASNIVPSHMRAAAMTASLLVQFGSIFATTSAVIAGPGIVSSLGGFEQYAWIFSAYTLASSIAIPLAGRLSDVAGRRIFYLGGLVVFITGNLLCALAPAIGFLIAARVFAGLGGGVLTAVSQATVGDVFPPRQRARWFAITMVVFGLGSSLGPFGGGYVVELLGWRWVFLANMVPAVLALALVPMAIPAFRRTEPLTVDWKGAVALAAGLCGLIFALTPETWLGRLDTPSRVAAGMAGLACLGLFVRHERRTDASILPPGLFQSPVFRFAVLANLGFAVAFNAFITFVPLYVIAVMAAGAETAGRVVLPLTLAHVVAGVVTGQVFSRWGHYRALAILAAVLSLAASVALALGADRELPGWLLMGVMLAAGFGTGIALPLMAVIIQGAFPYRLLATANSSRLFFLSIGTVVSVPALTALIMLPLAASARAGSLASNGDSLGAGLQLAFATVTVLLVIGTVIALKVPRIELADTFVEDPVVATT